MQLILTTVFLLMTNLSLLGHKQLDYRNEDVNQTGEILTSSHEFFVCLCVRVCVCVCVGIKLIYSWCGNLFPACY